MSPKNTSCKKKYNLLYINHIKECREKFISAFEQEYIILSSNSFAKSFKILEEHQVHLIVLEQPVLNIDALEFLHIIQNNYPELKFIPLASLTEVKALSNTNTLTNLWKYIHKPYDYDELKVVMNNALEIYQLKTDKDALINELKESEAKLIEAQHISKTGHWSYSIVNKQYTWSKEIFTILGYNSDEVEETSENFYKRIHPDDQERVKKEYYNSIKTNEVLEIHYRVKLPNNTLKYIIEKCVTKYNNTGEAINSTGTIQDITTQVESKMALKKSEEKLKENTLLFEEAQRMSHLGVWQRNIQTNEAYWSDELYNIYGINKDNCPTASYEKYLEIIHPDDKNRVVNLIEEAFNSKKQILFESKILRPNNETRYLKSWGQIILNDEGNPIKMIGACLDVTDQKIAEKELRVTKDKIEKSEKQFRELFEKSGDALLILKNEYFIDCNQSVLDMFGFETKKDLFTTHPSQISPEFQPNGMTSFEEAENMMRKAINEGFHRFEWTHTRNNGENFPAEVLLTTIVNEPDNKIIHAVVRDITNRKKYELGLKNSEEKFRTFTESIKIGILVLQDDKLKYVNKECENILEYTKEELLQLNYKDLLHPDNINSVAKKHEHRIQDKHADSNYEIKIISKSGELKNISITAVKIDYQGKPASLSAFQDITDKKKAQSDLIKLNSAINNSINEVFIFDAENLNFSYVNKGAINNLQYSFEELQYMTPLNIKPDYTLKQFKKTIKPLVNGSIKRLMFETNHIRKDNTIYPVHVNLSTFYINNNLHFLALIIDVTTRKKLEVDLKEKNKKLKQYNKELNKAQEQLRQHKKELENLVQKRTKELFEEKVFSDAVINNLPGIFSLIAIDGTHFRWNKNHEEVTGYSKKDYKEMKAIGFFPKDQWDLIFKEMSLFETQEEINFETEILTKTGKRIPFFLCGTKIIIDNKVYVAGTGIDISIQKQTEEELRKQAKELAVFNEVMIDREMRIIEMKEEINKLSNKFGESKPYPEIWNND